MFKLLRALAVIALLSATTFAQNFTLQGGNFQLAGGAGPVANGSVILTLSNPAATVIATGGAATPVYTINLDANGNMPLTQVIGNSALTPPGTFYTAQLFTLANGGGTLISTQTWIVGPSAPYSGTLYPNVMVLPAVSFVGAVTVPSSTVTFSATPTFNAATVSKFYITLTGNVTSSTLTGAVKDQLVIFVISQDGVGSRTFAWPTNVKGQSIAPGAGLTSTQAFSSDGTNLWPIGEMTVSSGNVDVRANTIAGASLNLAGTGALLTTAQSGTGSLCMTTNCVMTTPNIGAATGTSVSATSGFPFTGLSGSTGTNTAFQLGRAAVEANYGIVSGNGFFFTNTDLAAGDFFLRLSSSTNRIYLGTGTGIAPFGVSNTAANFYGSTSGSTAVKASAVASGTLTFPAATDTLVGKATTDTLTNKTLTAPIISDPTISGNTNLKRIKANQGTTLVAGDFSSLGAFGTTASVSSVTGTDQAFSVSIASTGTGQSANATFLLTFHDGTWTNAPIFSCNRGENSAPSSYTLTSTTATTLTVTMAATAPVAASTYTFNCVGIGR
ncbi:MAG TPA: hypothetical protein VGQ12_00550 [Candidatus Angelobacter sp.]|jgi:hypothetical protein|nr:hypothetical protein [Candidatus Angelobacter sp.]